MHDRHLSRDRYLSPAQWEQQGTSIFQPSWQLVPPSFKMEPGWARRWNFTDGIWPAKLAIATDLEGVVRCFPNTCSHRGAPIVKKGSTYCYEGEEDRQPRVGGCALRCPYHGRRFGYDGSFISMPGYVSEDTEADSLRQLAVEAWGPFHFVRGYTPPDGIDNFWQHQALGNFEQWKEVLSHLPQEVIDREYSLSTRNGFGDMRVKTFEVQANWITYVENYLEGLHIPFVHWKLASAIKSDRYDIKTFDFGVMQTAYDRSAVEIKGIGGRTAGLTSESAAVFPDGAYGYYCWLFPNLMLNFYPWGLSINVVQPVAQDLTHVTYYTLISDQDFFEYEHGTALEKVEGEDREIVQATFEGIQSPLYRPGKYVLPQEDGVRRFHALLRQGWGEPRDRRKAEERAKRDVERAERAEQEERDRKEFDTWRRNKRS